MENPKMQQLEEQVTESVYSFDFFKTVCSIDFGLPLAPEATRLFREMMVNNHLDPQMSLKIHVILPWGPES